MLAHREGSTNLLLHSDDMNNVVWGDFDIVPDTNYYDSPDRLVKAHKSIPSTNQGLAHSIDQVLNTRTNGQDYVYSVYAKSAGYNSLSMSMDGTLGVKAVGFNLTTGGVVGSDASIIEAGVEPSYNGYHRCWCRQNFTNTFTKIYFAFGPLASMAVDGSYNGFSGDGTSGIYLFGAQVQLDRLTDYIPTGASASIIPSDNLNIPYSGNTDNAGGVILFRFTPRVAGINASGLLSFTSTSNNSLLYQDSGGAFKSHDGTNTVTKTQTYLPGDDMLVALCYKASSNSSSVMVSKNGSPFTSTDGVYDGAFTLSNLLIELGLNSPSIDIRNIQAYYTGFASSDLATMKTWVDNNALTNT